MPVTVAILFSAGRVETAEKACKICVSWIQDTCTVVLAFKGSEKLQALVSNFA